jgi:hypothetical protein
MNLFQNPQNVFHPGVVCTLNCLAAEQAVMGDSVMATPISPIPAAWCFPG